MKADQSVKSPLASMATSISDLTTLQYEIKHATWHMVVGHSSVDAKSGEPLFHDRGTIPTTTVPTIDVEIIPSGDSLMQ